MNSGDSDRTQEIFAEAMQVPPEQLPRVTKRSTSEERPFVTLTSAMTAAIWVPASSALMPRT